MFVSLFFSFSMANSSIVLKSKIVKHFTDIDENCRNVCFESKVLNQYDIFDYLPFSNVKKSSGSSISSYLH